MQMDINIVTYNATSSNSILFLKKALSQLTKDSDTEKPIDKEDAILSCIYIQLSLELAIKAVIIKRVGITSILDKSKHNKDSEEELLKKFNNNSIKVKEFDSLKNFVKANKQIFNLDKNHISYIEKFQNIRNKLVHMNYNFTIEEFENMKKDLIFVIAHIIIKLLAEDAKSLPSEFYIQHLNHQEFNKLINYRLYRTEMEELAKQSATTVYLCPICSNYSLNFDNKFCYTCLSVFDDDSTYGFLDCDYCNSKESVIYDRLNVHFNDHIIRGLCLECKEDALVYECPICSYSYNIDTNLSGGNNCNNAICKKLNRSH